MTSTTIHVHRVPRGDYDAVGAKEQHREDAVWKTIRLGLSNIHIYPERTNGKEVTDD